MQVQMMVFPQAMKIQAIIITKMLEQEIMALKMGLNKGMMPQPLKAGMMAVIMVERLIVA